MLVALLHGVTILRWTLVGGRRLSESDRIVACVFHCGLRHWTWWVDYLTDEWHCIEWQCTLKRATFHVMKFHPVSCRPEMTFTFHRAPEKSMIQKKDLMLLTWYLETKCCSCKKKGKVNSECRSRNINQQLHQRPSWNYSNVEVSEVNKWGRESELVSKWMSEWEALKEAES